MRTFLVQALLFDLDGTLVDSTASVNRNWARMADRLGWDPAEVVGRYHGMTAAQTFRTIDPTLPEERVRELNAEMIAGETADTVDVVAAPGAAALLDALPADRWTIVTSCPVPLAEARLAAAGLPSHPHMVTADHVLASKPDPEPYVLGAARLGFTPEECLAVEDAPAGVASAAAAGCLVLGVGVPGPAGADHVVPDFARVVVEVAEGGLRVSVPR